MALLKLFALLIWITAVVPVFAQNADDGDDGAEPASFAYAAEFRRSGESTLITIKFDGKPDYRIFFMENPDRMIVELTGADFRYEEPEASDLPPLLSASRHGRINSSKSRMVVSLASPLSLQEKKLDRVESGKRHILTLSLSPVTREAYAASVAEQAQLLGNSGESVVKGDRVRIPARNDGRFVIVIDPGHGGIDGGASGRKSKVLEKDIVLKVGLMLGELIGKSGPYEVLYTRTEDVFVSLRERQRFARRSGADLMISLHADSLRQRFVRGLTVYTLAKRASDSLSRELAESENLSDVVAGLAAPEAKDEVADILADLTLRETTRFSRNFANNLVDQLRSRVNLINNPHRSASFMVLKNAEIPAVLMELGYLSNVEDERLLNDAKWRERLVAIVADSVRAFFAGRQPRTKTQ